MSVVVDTSALAAVVFGEPDAETYARALSRAAGQLRLSAATAVEVRIVVETRAGAAAVEELSAIVSRLRIETVSVDEAQAAVAVAAWRRFGKGRHPARLNYGDCFSYALAKVEGAPLLYKGEDFAQTDITSAL